MHKQPWKGRKWHQYSHLWVTQRVLYEFYKCCLFHIKKIVSNIIMIVGSLNSSVFVIWQKCECFTVHSKWLNIATILLIMNIWIWFCNYDSKLQPKKWNLSTTLSFQLWLLFILSILMSDAKVIWKQCGNLSHNIKHNIQCFHKWSLTNILQITLTVMGQRSLCMLSTDRFLFHLASVFLEHETKAEKYPTLLTD